MEPAAPPPKRRGPARLADPRPLFEDTSAGGGSPGRGFGAPPPPSASPAPGPGPAPFPPPGAFLAQPVSSLAAAYGSSLASHVEDNLGRWVPVGRLKYYFAVDTVYVAKKLRLLIFPFGHQDWQVRYQQDAPVAPRFDVNAPDLYIPAMAFLTYILLAGLALGTQNRTSGIDLDVLNPKFFPNFSQNPPDLNIEGETALGSLDRGGLGWILGLFNGIFMGIFAF
ncbi:hypothetical protein HGM15179_018570 [Zosterops borbonicus]|uniref:Protein YIF1 n=1 Tax=Zosterops borbonicus TaxID=364589 RepID=A0A8K1DBY0_9PASS|nr:hypothetical protein HGM15179_018570 [Zosterops borbonicus]